MKKPRILLADDSSRIHSAVKKLLSQQFEIVDCVLNGNQAVDAVMCLQPDLVVLDIMMPQLDGIQAAQRLKQLGSTAKIVFLTGIEDPDYIKTASDLGSQASSSSLVCVKTWALRLRLRSKEAHSITASRSQ